ncbi:serpin family protein [uncultured Flavonifractor sp.]|uniref:serpin family protein n=1 Tax=uncultured Flavonifractor sp. TaxID=1193534 RepID=UPI0026140DB9|nr:serpin family protein [uncultured Flavonifractor sp.]
MMDHYKRANDALHPTPEAAERAIGGGKTRRKRKPLKALVPAGVAAAAAAALLVTGIPGMGRGGGPLAGSAYAIAQPTYPDLPQCPAEPMMGTEGAWERYQEEYDVYWNAWRAYQDEVPRLYKTPELEQALAAFTGESAALALAGEENRVYSPVSLWFALAILAETTGGETRQQVLEALGASDVEQLRDWADILWHTVYQDDGTATALLGNSIWLHESVSFHQGVLETLAEDYYAASYQVPMGTDEADNALAGWVAEQTRGLIGSEGKVLETTADTLTVLASTLYFQAGWSDEFNENRTEEDIFTAADGTETRIDFMHRTQDAGFLRQNGYQAASLSTKGGTMTFVLPDEGVSPADLLANPEFLTELTDSESQIYGEVQWSVPKFDVNSELNLKPTLEGLGITDVFDAGTSDFTPLTDLEPVWLDQVKQLTRVKVDEKGVEAAAVTLLADAGAGAPPEDPQICVMDLNRPFLFVIRDGNAVLFVGVVERV